MSDHWWLRQVGVGVPSDVLEERDAVRDEPELNSMVLHLATDDGRDIVVFGTRRLFNDSRRVADDREVREFAQRLREAINTVTREMS